MGDVQKTENRRPVIIEEKPVCRLALAQVLSDCCAGAQPIFIPDRSDISKALDGLTPVVILIDLFTVNYDFSIVAQVTGLNPECPVIVLDDRLNPIFVGKSRDAGAAGYIAKAYELEDFMTAIRRVLEGGTAFPDIAPQNSSTAKKPNSPAHEFKLSAKQYETLMLVSLGMTNKEIAQTMRITPGTAKLHTHSVLKAIGARNRTEAALIAGRIFAQKPSDPETT